MSLTPTLVPFRIRVALKDEPLRGIYGLGFSFLIECENCNLSGGRRMGYSNAAQDAVTILSLRGPPELFECEIGAMRVSNGAM